MSNRLARWGVLPIIIAIAVAPRVALAADPPKSDAAAAERLFYEGRALMQQSHFVEACPKLEQSLRLDAGVGTQFNLADCNEHLGKLTTAWTGFLEVAAQAKSRNQPDREKLARKRAAALEPRLPKLIVDARGGSPGLEVKRDGIAIVAAAWGTAIPLDPGPHRIVASAPGRQSWETTVTMTEGTTSHVAIPHDLSIAGASGVSTTAITSASLSDPNAEYFPPPMIERPFSTQGAIGWIVAGAGVVGVGVGVGYGLTSIGKRSESRSHCSGNVCDAVGVGLRDDAMRAGNVATIATIAGAAALAGGLLLVISAPKETALPERVPEVRAVPTVGLNGGGFALQGSFQ